MLSSKTMFLKKKMKYSEISKTLAVLGTSVCVALWLTTCLHVRPWAGFSARERERENEWERMRERERRVSL